MNTLDKQYINLLRNIKQNGMHKGDRTGTGTQSISGAMIQHNMAEGFPLLTTKKVAFKTMATELEGFIKGITSKDWYQNRNCHIWDEWCNPMQVPSDVLNNEERKAFQVQELDLGPIYGRQWRNFNGDNYDQLEKVLHSLECHPNDRRMIVSAWNPLQLDQMALPPCHLLWQVIVRGGYLDLLWYQRSVDVFLGLPFNIASYGLLLELLAHQFGYKSGILTGFLGDTHIYNNLTEQVDKQISRDGREFTLPSVTIASKLKDIRDFNSSEDIVLIDYSYHPSIRGEVSV
jgi:thymidylate synthase